MNKATGALTGVPDATPMLPVICNTVEPVLHGNICINGARDLPVLQRVKEHDGHAVLVGGGPSLTETLDEIKWRYGQGQHIVALNGSADWLVKNGIIPHSHIIIDARPGNARFVAGVQSTKLYLASQCDPSVFEKAKFRDVTLFHRDCDGKSGFNEKRRTVLLGTGTTVGLTAIQLMYELGYRKIHLYGYDSSYRKTEGHAYLQPENDGEQVVDCTAGGRKFTAAVWMIRQAEEFRNIAPAFAKEGVILTVHGDGLLPWVAKKLTEPFERGVTPSLLTAVYDLALSPASYDILVFLGLAECHRKAQGYDGIRFVIVPGPNQGFRFDEIAPEEPEHRQQLLWNVVIPAARLLPSVKSIHLCGSRSEALQYEGDVFPESYNVDYPLHAYGMTRQLEAMRAGEFAWVKAPKRALELAAPYISPCTVTITLRETHYGQGRNSQLDQWKAAAKQLRDAGCRVLFIRDTGFAAYGDEDFGETCAAASFDLALRAAIYELADLNVFIANGPAGVSYFNPKCKTLMFGMIAEGHNGMTEPYWKAMGFPPGSQFPGLPNCKLVWESDQTDVIVRESLSMLNAIPQTETIDG